MRYDLTFFLCCCKSFLGSDDAEDGEDFYSLLGVDRDASAEEIKKAYKRQSLQMHPDKLAQRGKTVTEEDQAKFTRMKEAYEVLSDPHKRETYDAIGERGMKWMEEPFSIDPQELAHNFARSSALDRSKIFSIFVGMAVAVLLLPVLVCLHVDGVFGPEASWFATLVPLWLWDAFILFYHTRVIMLGPISRPDHIPPEEWVDPLPMKKRIFSLVRFILIVLFEVLVAFKLDEIINVAWSFVFFPLYIWEATTLYKKWPLARMRIVTVDDLEAALGKPFSEFTPAEKELIGKRYSVVPSTTSPEFEAAQKLKSRARLDIIKSLCRIVFVLVLLVQLDGNVDYNWWLVFTPFWLLTLQICLANYLAFAEVQRAAMEKDPSLFGVKPEDLEANGAVKEGEAASNSNSNINEPSAGYGAVGTDGAATPAAASEAANVSQLTEEEREELKAHVMASSSRLCSKCCSQGFLLFVVILFVAKLQGAGFSSLWIISPFLLVAGIILCCLGCAIFGITEVPTEGVEFDTSDFGYVSGGSPPHTAAASEPYVPPPASAAARETSEAFNKNEVNNPSPDPEKGDVKHSSTTISSSTQQKQNQEATQSVDLLDDNAARGTPAPSEEFHDLD